MVVVYYRHAVAGGFGQLDAAVDETAYLENISIEENPMGTVEIIWDALEGAVYYEVTSPGVNEGEAVRTEEPMYTAEGLDHGADYDFTLAAFDERIRSSPAEPFPSRRKTIRSGSMRRLSGCSETGL